MITANVLDFCYYPKSIFYANTELFSRDVNRLMMKRKNITNITIREYNQIIMKNSDTSKYQKEIIYSKNDTPRIPFITHRIWLTDPYDPKEMQQVLPEIISQIQSTQKQFDISAKQHNQKWNHYLWVQEQNLIPQTIQLFEQMGFRIKLLSELKEMKIQRVQKQFSYYLEDLRMIGAASDFIRGIIVKENGGVYLDNDYYFESWDYNINYYFDFLGVQMGVTPTLRGINNAFFAAKQDHPIIQNYFTLMMDVFKFEDEEKERPLFLNSCSFRTTASTIFGTGPPIISLAAMNFINQSGNQDIIVNKEYSGIFNHQTIQIIDEKGEQKELKIEFIGKDIQTQTWRRDMQDSTIFGWPQFNSF
ncbi:UNKNOWN [Stylonychia lemnae]|uniref:GT44 domain-containing protein n=1 Tax=Stylonychia lemnae TaxID=5949 RepID=A0A077ZPB1_STYLE|nr:UNKNOWN [Stylonychia lemnae]|eukprot:CDW71225.1 UNKNOWN [Stylonychia lemnae]